VINKVPSYPHRDENKIDETIHMGRKETRKEEKKILQ
jgi:hypothetical protein